MGLIDGNAGQLPAPLHVTSFGRFAVGGVAGQIGVTAVTAWPTANLGIYVPFRLDMRMVVARLFWANGATTGTPNVDCGIYDESGTRLASAGSTVMTGANVIQYVDITDLALDTGQYYFAFACSNNTATFPHQVPANVIIAQLLGCAQEASAVPLPATATFASMANAYIPYCGLTTETTL